MRRSIKRFIVECFAVLLTVILYGIPFYFILVTSFKDKKEASWMTMDLPSQFHIIENYKDVFTYNNYMVVRAFINSTLMTFLSIIILVVVSSMAGYVLQRRRDKYSKLFNFIILSGLIIPPAIVPTIWVLNALHIQKTLFGLIMVEVAISFSFATILYKGFMASIPVELDEAALVDGCGKVRLFFTMIFPLLKPVTSTIVVLTAVNIFNDFVNPLYFLPGNDNTTVQLTLYFFQSKYDSTWNLLFADVVLISIPPLIMYIFFNKQIVSGMTAGSVKG